MAMAITAASASTVMASSDTYKGYGSEYDGYVSVANTSYRDVPETHWAHDAIVRVGEKGWFGGYPDGSFRPEAQISRAEALKVLVVSHGLSVVPVTSTSYQDVYPTDWYAPYIEAGKGILPVITVMGQSPFRPNQPVLREDMAYALVKVMGLEGATALADQSVLNMFTDAYSISSTLKPYVAVAVSNGLLSGFSDNTIRAQDPLSRAEFATVLYRATFHGYN